MFYYGFSWVYSCINLLSYLNKFNSSCSFCFCCIDFGFVDVTYFGYELQECIRLIIPDVALQNYVFFSNMYFTWSSWNIIFISMMQKYSELCFVKIVKLTRIPSIFCFYLQTNGEIYIVSSFTLLRYFDLRKIVKPCFGIQLCTELGISNRNISVGVR